MPRACSTAATAAAMRMTRTTLTSAMTHWFARISRSDVVRLSPVQQGGQDQQQDQVGGHDDVPERRQYAQSDTEDQEDQRWRDPPSGSEHRTGEQGEEDNDDELECGHGVSLSPDGTGGRRNRQHQPAQQTRQSGKATSV